MNRQQRRTAGIKGKDPVHIMKQSDLDRVRQQAQSDASAEAMALLLSLVIRAVRRKYGWGRKRLGDLCEAIIDEYAELDESSMSLSDYQDFVYETVGIKFKTTD